MFNGGSAHNVISEKSYMEGTVRTFNNNTRDNIVEIMETMIKGITEANGADYEFNYRIGYPAVLKESSIGGEDFSYFAQKVPSAFFLVGTHNKEKSIESSLHNPYFNIDEDILDKASSVMAECVFTYLNNKISCI